jgi:arylsulfatase A-like enzyme
MARPNILYLHSHDTGREVQPYTDVVPTPNILRLADAGTVYRNAFSAAPVCSPSRAALLTGAHHQIDGLAHRGFRLKHPGRHIVHTLNPAGYTTTMVGEQHVMPDPREIGYDRICETIPDDLRPPFFFSVGLQETHRPFPPAATDMDGFRRSVAEFDRKVGEVLERVPDDTVVILTTDHGIPFPGAKATLSDRGIGVLLIIRGLGRGVSDELVSQIDVFPTICDLAGIPRPPWLQGRSLLSDPPNDAVFAEMTFHAAYEPQRALRTTRYKYIRRYEDGLVLANIDDSPTKDEARLTPQPREQFYDLVDDPDETHNLPVPDEFRARLDAWMHATEDPLRHGRIEPPPGVELNSPDQISPDDPTYIVQ